MSTNTCELLLLGSEDPNVLSTYSLFDRQHVALKTSHVVDALGVLYSATGKEKPITWIEVYEIAYDKNYGVVSRAKTIVDWHLELHHTNKSQFR